MNSRRRPTAYTLDDPCVVEGRCPGCGAVPEAGFEEREHGWVILVVEFQHADDCPVVRDLDAA